jgi:ankyrin repeat protein
MSLDIDPVGKKPAPFIWSSAEPPLYQALQRKCSLEHICGLINSRTVNEEDRKFWESRKLSPLLYSIQCGRYDVAKVLVEQEATVHCVDKDGNSALLLLCQKNPSTEEEFELIKLLIEKKADVNIFNLSDKRPLHLAAEHDNAPLASLLIKSGAYFACFGDEKFPLHVAASKGHLQVIKALQEADPDKFEGVLNLEGRSGFTPLHVAVEKGYLDIAEFLLQHRAKLEIQNNAGLSPIHTAAANGRIAFLELFQKYAPDIFPYQTQTKDRKNALHLATENKSLPVVGFFLNHHTRLEEKDNKGWSPIHIAAGLGLTDLLTLFSKERPDLFPYDACTDEGDTPLHLATQKQRLDAAAFLLSNGSNPRQKNGEGLTPAHIAAAHGNIDFLTVLLEQDRNLLRALSSDGQMPLHLAASQGHIETALFLLSHGLNPTDDVFDNWSDLKQEGASFHTPIAVAVMEGQKEFVAYFLSKRSDLLDDTLLTLAISCKDISIAIFLIDQGADLGGQDAEGKNALHLATIHSNSDTDFLQKLLIKRPDLLQVCTNDHECFSLLHLVAKHHVHINIAKLLLDQGVDLSIKGKDGMTAIHLAAGYGRVDLLKLFLEREPELFHKTLNTVTTSNAIVNNKVIHAHSNLLHFTTQCGCIEATELLLENGVNFCTKDARGWTPVHVAANEGWSKHLKLFSEKNPPSFISIIKPEKMEPGDTLSLPLYLASSKNHRESMAFLKQNSIHSPS